MLEASFVSDDFVVEPELAIEFARAAIKHLKADARAWDVVTALRQESFGFVRETLGDLKKDPIKLREDASNEQLDRIAEWIANWATSIHRDYVFFIPLSKFQPFGAETLEVAPGAVLLHPSAGRDYIGVNCKAAAEWDKVGGRSGWLKEGIVHLQVAASGLYTYSAGQSASYFAVARAKHFLMLATAEQIVEETWDVGANMRLCPTVCTTFGRQEFPLELIQSTSVGFASHRFVDSTLRVPPKNLLRSLLDPEEPQNEAPADQLQNHVRDRLRGIHTLLTAPPQTPGLPELLAACEWLFDSTCERNETISYLQACTAFEALLGSGNSEGVTRELSDRFAFLLGTTKSEREALIARFARFYKARSSIVHGRRIQLADEEVDQLYWARGQLQRAIRLEAIALMREVQGRAH